MRVASPLLLPLLFACAVDEAAEGEGEGDEGCADAVFVFDDEFCAVVTAGENDLHVVADGVDLTVSSFGPLAAAQELDETNSSCFATFARGDDVYRVATGAIGGIPVGECNVDIAARDDGVGFSAAGDGFAAKDGDDLAAPLFFTFRARF